MTEGMREAINVAILLLALAAIMAALGWVELVASSAP